MSKRDGGSGGGRAWCGYVAAITVGAAVLILLRMTSSPTTDAVRDFINTSLRANNATAEPDSPMMRAAGSAEAQAALLDPPNLMVPAPRDPAKTKAARAALDAMKARMKKDFVDQWAALTPAEQAAVKKKWKEDWLKGEADAKRIKAERAARREAGASAQAGAGSRRMLRGVLSSEAFQ